MPLRLLYIPDDKVAEVDIIAVHGLNPRSVPEEDHAWDTWRKPSGDKGRLWLRDDLPKYAPYARIFLYQYNSKLVYGGDKARFIDKANDLLEVLRIERKKDGKRPLIFLAHSLGGILVRQALVSAHNNPKYNLLHTSTSGLAFFGTPHEGGDERLVALGAAAARIASALHVQPSNDLIETLKKGSLFSDLLAEQWRHHLESYQLVSFWEGIGDIVPKKSATFGLSGSRENVVRLEAAHSDLCRFDEDDQDHSKLVLNNIEDLYEHAISTSYNFDVRQALEWVSRIPYEQHHNTNKSEILRGTGLWLFQEEIFIKWKQDYRSTILWLHGIPGCGKTKLVSLVIEEQRAALDERQALAFFYCNRNDAEPERANPEGILRSIVRQLSIFGPHARLSKVVAAKYIERERKHFADGPLRLDECVDLIIKLTEQYTSTIIIIDALDECDVSTRHSLLVALSSIMQHGSSTKIFVSSRDDKDITLQLSDLPNLYIKASNNAKDIDRYVHVKVKQAVADKRLLDGNVSVATVQLISDTLTDKAQGMFLWVTLQLQNLCSLRLNVEKDLLEELGRLPQGLANTYAQIFEHVKRLGPHSRVIADMSLKWLLCQARRLSEAEFLAAVSMGTKRETINLTKETILFICGNLVMFDHHLKVFRFAHLSVREYLEIQPDFTLDAAHALGAETSLLICLHRYTVLAAKDARTFRGYATRYLLYHCQETKKSILGGSLRQLLEDFLHIREGTNLYYAVWARSIHKLIRADNKKFDDRWQARRGDDYNPRVELEDEWSDGTDDDLISGTLKERRPGSGARISGSRLAIRNQAEDMMLGSILPNQDCPYDPTFMACFLGIPEIVEQNLQSVLSRPIKKWRQAREVKKAFNPRNVREQTYLHVACLSGSYKLLRLLLQWRLFSVFSGDIWGKTALHYVAVPHDLFLLKPAETTRAILVAHDQSIAAERVAMIGLLVKKGSVVDAVDLNGETALHRASSANLVTEAQTLLEHGAFVGSRDNNASTPLILATELGHITVVRLLLQFGADTEAKNKQGMTPLLQATESGHTAVVRLLLQFGADTEAKNKQGMTPLLQAAESGHTAIVQLLLPFKADIEVRSQDGRTPLYRAMMRRHFDTARLFLQLGADINAKDSYAKTLLACSLERGDQVMAQMLIDEGTNIEVSDSIGNTALHYAAAYGFRVMVSKLLETGAQKNVTNAYGSTPLHVAIDQKCASLTFQKARDYTFDTVQLLVDAGASIEMGDNRGRTPLHLAAREANKASIRILLDRGANIKAEDTKGLLPLDYAAVTGSLEVFSFLFERWADVMAESSENAVESWLHLAAKPLAVQPQTRILEAWRNMDIEDLIELTNPGSKMQRIWAKMDTRGLNTWYRARLIVKEMRARRPAQPVI